MATSADPATSAIHSSRFGAQAQRGPPRKAAAACWPTFTSAGDIGQAEAAAALDLEHGVFQPHGHYDRRRRRERKAEQFAGRRTPPEAPPP